jgi:hypothetical protein
LTTSPGLVAALVLACSLAPSPADADPLAGLEAGAAVVVIEGGSRLRTAPTTRSDVVTGLEQGRVLELVERGETATIAGVDAPWVRVRDPWAPLSGVLAGPWEGWVWGGLLAPSPAGTPEVTHALWDRMFAAAGSDGATPRAWGLRSAAERDGALELGEWIDADPAPDRIRQLEGWTVVEAVHLKEPGGDRPWLWVLGRSAEGQRRGLLIPTGSDAEPLDLVLSTDLDGGQRLDGEFFLIDLDGDGVDEAVVQWVRRGADGEPIERHFAPFELAADGTSRPGRGQLRDALLPPPDLRITGVVVEAVGRRARLEIRVVNDGSRSEPTRLEVRVSPVDGRGRTATVEAELPLPALSAEETRELDLEVDLPRGAWGRCYLEVLAVPVGVELGLDNNRLARWTTL